MSGLWVRLQHSLCVCVCVTGQGHCKRQTDIDRFCKPNTPKTPAANSHRNTPQAKGFGLISSRIGQILRATLMLPFTLCALAWKAWHDTFKSQRCVGNWRFCACSYQFDLSFVHCIDSEHGRSQWQETQMRVVPVTTQFLADTKCF